MAMSDQDRHVVPVAQNSWDTHVSFAPADASSLDWTVDKEVREGEDEKLVLDSTQMAALLVFVQRVLLDPLTLHAYLNPVQVPVDISVLKTVRGKPIPTVSAAAQTRKTDSEPMMPAKGRSEKDAQLKWLATLPWTPPSPGLDTLTRSDFLPNTYHGCRPILPGHVPVVYNLKYCLLHCSLLYARTFNLDAFNWRDIYARLPPSHQIKTCVMQRSLLFAGMLKKTT